MKQKNKIKPVKRGEPVISIRGATQNNLRNVDLDIRLGEFTVVTGLSGAGKSSLVFDTLYAEGQRRYVETFSPYARQFLDRMNRPEVKSIDGIPPAIAIDQSGSVRTSRSTVGTMSELNDHLKVLFANHASLFCPGCGSPVREHSPESIYAELLLRLAKAGLEDARVYVTFELTVPPGLPLETARSGLSAQGFTRIIAEEPLKDGGTRLTVVADRFKASRVEAHRAIHAFALALEKGSGKTIVYIEEEDGSFTPFAPYEEGFVCAACRRSFTKASSSAFSFNSPLGACPTCKGFGKELAINPELVIPDPSLSLVEGAVKPWSTPAFSKFNDELLWHAKRRGIPVCEPYSVLSAEEKDWIWNGDPGAAARLSGIWDSEAGDDMPWYGILNFFKKLEEKNYKMHVRVMLSRYRSEVTCKTCHGARLKPGALYWRYGRHARPEKHRTGPGCFLPVGMDLPMERYLELPGFNFHELMNLPVRDLLEFFRGETEGVDEAEAMLLKDVVNRLTYMCEVGLGYLTLDRRGRTLSGGEVQRVSLASALGTSLVNTLFVLDEPSVGLHPRDMDRVNAVMRRLTDAGNTLVVVEHDPQVMLAGQRLVELGPKAGREGGRIVFDGTTREALESPTLTGEYLSGKKRVERAHPMPVDASTPVLSVIGASENNLKDIDVHFPLGALVAVAGVSGSGKSTLIGDILEPALNPGQKKPGRYKRLEPARYSRGPVIYVDQSAVGRTSRGNTASYTKVFDPIRRLFAATSAAKALGLGYVDFSFNSGEGRCPTCMGTGYEDVEMQFLSDIHLPCPTCGGKRYKESTLSVKLPLADGEYDVSQVLDMTVSQAKAAFANHPHIVDTLTNLESVSLGYIVLGQPLNTLSGGELQRLKLAVHIDEILAKRRAQRALFIFDEPTTGLHFDDVRHLVDVFDRLVKLGHSIIVVEHNLDVLAAADWIIELGPDGGDLGGEVLFAGTPADIEKRTDSPTGQALAAWRRALEGDRSREDFFNLPALRTEPYDDSKARIEVNKANENNLKDLTVSIPREHFTVISGPSGSGKSTLAFDIIFSEGQRRYLESLNAYARSMVQPPAIPDVESVKGIPPTVAIEQRTSRGGMRSTVATMSELWHFLRLIFMKLGTQYCPRCHIPAGQQTPDAIEHDLIARFKGREVLFMADFVSRKKGRFRSEMERLRKEGRTLLRIDGAWVGLDERIPALDLHVEHTIRVPMGSAVVDEDSHALRELIADALLHGKGKFTVTTELPEKKTVSMRGDYLAHAHPIEETFYSTLAACPSCGESFPEVSTKTFSYNSPAGACPECSGYGVVSAALKRAQKHGEAFANEMSLAEMRGRGAKGGDLESCPACHGSRLNENARNVFWKGRSIDEVGRMSIRECAAFFEGLELDGREAAIGSDAIKEIRTRLAFLLEVGLDYLQLERGAPTLSGGESQRIRLAAQLGSNLKGACYILDEPTIGLHPRDNGMLLDAIESLTRKGNTLLVVEHDEETIRRAEHIIDIGPGAGTRGGRVVAEGSVEDIEAAPESMTGRFLKDPIRHTGVPETRFDPDSDPAVVFRKIRRHNLDIDELRLPLNRLTVITGVSGSGKSTLSEEVVYENLRRATTKKRNDPDPEWTNAASVEGWETVKRVLEVDQSPIGKTPRSCPATYIGFMDKIRDLFAQTTESQIRGYNASHYSFNALGGCPECAGQGYRTIAMSFLPDVKVECEVCRGSRYKQEVLSVTWKGRNISEVLGMEVEEACGFFESVPDIRRPLELLEDVGLGYLTLGQLSPTLSGGEAQRIKLVTELAKVKDVDVDLKTRRSPHTLYVLDEPTVGLHMGDVDRLVRVLKRLVRAGNTVVVVEHNLDVMAEADWIIDLGPEGGRGGGRVVGEGTPAELARRDTPTGHALKAFLEEHKAR